MKENTLKPGDKVGDWTVRKHVASGCIYSVKKEGDPNLYALKLREPHNQSRFYREIEILTLLNSGGGHPSFQKLYDYSNEDFWMVVTYANPDLVLSRLVVLLNDPIIESLDINQFTDRFIDAVRFALDRGVILSTTDSQIFIIDSRPFFIDLENCSLFKGMSKKQVLLGRLTHLPPIDAASKLMFFNQYFL